MKWARKCPECNDDVEYSTEKLMRMADRSNTKCVVCRAKRYSETYRHSPQAKKKISDSKKGHWTGEKNPMKKEEMKKYFSKMLRGENNGMFGKHHTDDAKRKISMHSRGKNNPMYGKPPPNGSGNGWANWYRGNHFRSLRELQFFISETDRGVTVESAQSIRIPYKDVNGNDRTYQPDFLVDGKELVEIKPKKLWNTKTVMAKKEAAELFCKNQNWTYRLIDVEPDSSILKEKYLCGEIRFVDKYKKRFEKYANIT